MISALRKISSDSYVAKANTWISSFFIADPKISYWNNTRFGRWVQNYASNGWKTKTSIRDSHPSIDDRIARLQSY
jgi:Zn-dependent protease with chaperone function